MSPEWLQVKIFLSDGDVPVVSDTEILKFPSGSLVVADAKNFWCQRPNRFGGAIFSEYLMEQGSAPHTRQLLAGALFAGISSRASGEATAGAADPSLERHIYSLAGSYQTTHATPPTMRHAAGRFSAMGNPAMAEYCLHVAEEEAGHDVLALKDLESLGLRSEAFVQEIQPASSLALVDIFQRFARGPSPIAVLGYAYALERFALFQTASSIEVIEALLPPGINATRCLRVHSSAGTDAHHVAESVDFIASLGRDDRKEIAMAAFETAAVMAAPSDYPGNEAMACIIGRYRN
jgi:hypothetical protein